MSVTQNTACISVQELFLGLLKNELTQQDAQQVSLHVAHCTHCNTQFENAKHVFYQTEADHISHSPVPEASERTKLLINIAWVFVIAGGFIIGVLLLWDLAVALWFDRSQPIWLRVSLALFYIGFAILFLVVLQQRLMARTSDAYSKMKNK